MKSIRLLALAFFVAVVASCMHMDVYRGLCDVESYIDDRPDSALAVLQAMDRSSLGSEKNEALFSLLYSKALDKCYVDVASDSIIAPAHAYYQDNGSDEHQMQMWYYYGRTQFNAGEHASAAISYMKSAELAEDLGDDFMAGLAYRGLGETYKANFNYVEALKYMNEAYDCFNNEHKTLYADYALFFIANTYMLMSDFETADSLYNKVYASALESNSLSLQKLVLEDRIYMYSALPIPEYDEVLYCATYIQDSLRMELSVSAQEDYIIALASLGRKHDAANLRRISSENPDTLIAYYNTYQYNKFVGNYEDALVALERAFLYNNKLSQEIVRQSVSSVQRDYFQKEYQYEQYKRQVVTALWVSICMFLILVLFCLYRYFVKRNKYKQEKIDSLLLRVDDLSRELRESSEVCNEFSYKIQQLYETKFKFIDSIGQKYYSYNGSARDRFILEDVNTMISQLADDKELEALEHILNAYKDNVISLLRIEFPKLKPKDMQFMCYWCAGFSPNTMSLLLDEKIENIYNRKSRMRRRLEESYSQYKDLFLGCFV